MNQRSARLWRVAARIALQLEFYVRAIRNHRSMLYGDLMTPVIYLAFLAAGLNRSVGTITDGSLRLSYLDFTFAGLLALTTNRVWTKTTGSVSNDRKWGTYALKRLSGFSVPTYLAGVVAIGFAVFGAQAVGLVIVGLALGVHLIFGRFVAAVAIALVAVIFWGSLGACVAVFIKNYQQRDLVITLTSLPVIFSAPVFYSFAAAPTYLQAISRVNPLSYQVQAIRGVLFGHLSLTDLGISGSLAVSAVVVAWLTLARADLISQER